MQGVRWMPASLAQKLVRAAAQLPCEPAEMWVAPGSSSWSARHAPAVPDGQEGVAVAVGRDGLTCVAGVDGHGEEQVSGARARDARTGEGARGCTKTVETAMEWARRELVSKEVVTAGSRVKVLVVGAELTGGFVCEVQLNLSAMYAAKSSGGHRRYILARDARGD